MSLSVIAVSANIFASEPITVEPGDIDTLTNALKQANATVRLKAGVYDLSPLTNAPMYAAGYYGASLLTVAANSTLIGETGNADDVVLKGAGVYRIIRTAGTGVTIRDLTISGGNAVQPETEPGQSYAHKGGGGINIFHSGCVVSNCVIEKCTAGHRGGAVCGYDEFNGKLLKCVIRDCYGPNDGGIAYGVEAHGCTISNNTEYSNMNYGLVNCRLFDCWFYDNTVYNVLLSSVVAKNCVFERNKSMRGNNNGCGIAYNSVVSNCSFYANKGHSGLLKNSSVYSCNIISNEGYNGVIHLASIVDKCEIVSNVVSFGSLCYCSNVINSTMAYNYSKVEGGAAYSSVLSNCVVRGNLAKNGEAVSFGAAYDTLFDNNDIYAVSRADEVINCVFNGNGAKAVRLFDRCRFHMVSNHVVEANNVCYPSGYSKNDNYYCFYSCSEFRNCIFSHNLCVATANNSNLSLFAAGTDQVPLNVVNCTFVSNRWQNALRDYKSANVPAVFVNCAFYRNVSNTDGAPSDMRGYDSGYTYLTNCVMGANQLSLAEGVEWVNVQRLGANYNPGFKFDAEHPYALKYYSILRGGGLMLDWMQEEGSVDFAGHPRTSAGLVDIGAYQYWYEPKGTRIILR